MTEQKIIQGDCLEVMKTMADNSVDCVVTSPPYNKGYWRQRKMGNEGDTWKSAGIDYVGSSDNMPQDEYEAWQRSVLDELVRVIKPKGSIFYNHKPLIYRHRLIYPTWVFDYTLRQHIIWDRGSTPSIDPIRFYPTTESIFWITKDAHQPKFKIPDVHKTEVWRIPPRPTKGHPAPFPLELAETCIIATTDEGDTVFDPFAGSGTTCVAAKALNRQYIGIEREEEYIKIAEARLAAVPETLFA